MGSGKDSLKDYYRSKYPHGVNIVGIERVLVRPCEVGEMVVFCSFLDEIIRKWDSFDGTKKEMAGNSFICASNG